MENIFYVAVIVFSATASVWAIGMAFRLSPSFQAWRGNRKLEAIVKLQEAARTR